MFGLLALRLGTMLPQATSWLGSFGSKAWSPAILPSAGRASGLLQGLAGANIGSTALGIGQTIGRFMPAFTGYAMLQAAGSLKHWADTNVAQTAQISSDSELQRYLREQELLLDREKFEYEQDQDLLDYEQNLESINLVGQYDLASNIQRQEMQQSEQAFETRMFELRQEQLVKDRESFIKDNAFKEQQESSQMFGTPEPAPVIAYILTELAKMMETPSFEIEEEPELNQFNYFYKRNNLSN